MSEQTYTVIFDWSGDYADRQPVVVVVEAESTEEARTKANEIATENFADDGVTDLMDNDGFHIATIVGDVTPQMTDEGGYIFLP